MTQAQTTPASGRDPAGAPTDDIVVKALGLTKIFKDFWLRDKVRAVDAIDFEILRGEVFGLLGPNGSGKSTTIKMILGLLHPSGGKLAVFGNLPRDVSTKKRIGYLPEETYLYRFLTPVETLEYYAKLFHLNRSTRKKRIAMLLDMVGLEHAANRPVGEFSKGMMRKVGLAQALINDPEFLILDEPTSGMDPIATDDVKKVIRQLRDRGKTILLCSHLLADVQDVCDRVAMMFGGKIRREGQLDGLLQVQDKTTITTGALAQVSDEQIVAALEKLGVTDVALDHPRRTLEQVFLEMVDEAQKEGLQTFGARSGRDVAAFLQGEEGEVSAEQRVEQQREVLIESLVSGEPDKPAASAEDVAEPIPAPPPPPTEADNVLAGLTGEKPAEPEKPKTPPPPSKPTGSKPDADSGVIDDLLSG
ncbi:MAG: ABC transporter ATP-binding protein [Phycisphaeraceae bacterium]|nr:ABC transporter ATP-binding protein [Phycisphaeraceae bacterium]